MSSPERDTVVRCATCNGYDNVVFWRALMNGWPTCCGETMRLETYPNPDAVQAATDRAIRFQLDYPREPGGVE